MGYDTGFPFGVLMNLVPRDLRDNSAKKGLLTLTCEGGKAKVGGCKNDKVSMQILYELTEIQG